MPPAAGFTTGPGGPDRREPLHVVAADDGSDAGFDLRSLYVELFWLPVLGPSATWLLRRLADGLDARPEGFSLDPGETARALGLGTGEGRHSSFHRTLGRCVRFGVAHQPLPGLLAVRRRVGVLTEGQIARLPPSLRLAHVDWAAAGDPVAGRRRARLLALDATWNEGDPARLEARLTAWGVPPAVARETVEWVSEVTGGAG